MYIFTEFEKEIINSIAATQPERQLRFGDIISPLIFGRNSCALFMIHSSKSYNLFTRPGNNAQAKSIYAKLAQLFALLDYLKENRYITLLPLSPTQECDIFYEDAGQNMNISNTSIFINPTKPNLRIEISNNPATKEVQAFIMEGNDKILQGYTFTPELYTTFLHYLLSVVYPTTRLIDLTKNNFIPDEERHYQESIRLAYDQINVANKQIRQATHSLRLSIVAIIIAILSPILTIFISNKWGVSTINKEQFEELIQQQKEISKQSDNTIHKQNLQQHTATTNNK